MRIPLWMRIRIKESDRKNIRLSIPLFLVWLLLLPLLLLALPFVLIAALLTWHRGHGRMILAAVPLLITVIGHLPGLHIEVDNPENQTLITIY
jgi:hypothetical protein